MVGGSWWLRPILVFSLSLDQAEQKDFFGQKTSSDFTPIQEDDRQHKKKQAGNELKNKKRSFLGKNSDKN